MNVRIAYGVELDSVPDKVIEMLNEYDLQNINELINISKMLLKIDSDNSETASSLIDQARQNLAKQDRILQDAQMILKGYISTLETQEVSKPNPTNESVQNAD